MDKEIVECNLEKSERHPHRNERDPEVIRQRRIIGTNISKEKTSMVRKISTMKQTDQGTRLPRKFLKTWYTINQCKKRGTWNISIRESYHNDFKKINIDKFETRKVKRKTRATFLEEEKISKLVNAGDLNYLIQLGNSPEYHEMVEYCLELKRGS